MTKAPWHSRFALILALLLPLYFALAALGTKFGLWGWRTGLLTLTIQTGPILMGVVALAALISLIVVLLRKPRKGWLVSLIALLMSPISAQASRYKQSATGGTSSVSPQNAFLAPSLYSRGGAAKTRFSFTTSPLWALVGLAKVKGDLRLLHRLSIAVQAAGGYSVPHDAPTLGVGAQVAVFLSGNFDRGWSLGGNFMQFGSMLSPADLVNSPWDRFEGAYIGWKSTAGSRNVLELQLGVQRWHHADSSPLEADAPSIVPTLGLNYGWAW